MQTRLNDDSVYAHSGLERSTGSVRFGRAKMDTAIENTVETTRTSHLIFSFLGKWS